MKAVTTGIVVSDNVCKVHNTCLMVCIDVWIVMLPESTEAELEIVSEPVVKQP